MMRKGGRSVSKLRFFPRRRGSALPFPWDVVDGPFTVRASIVPVGLSLVRSVTWTGRVVRQAVHPRSCLGLISPDAWRATMESFFKRPGAVGTNGKGASVPPADIIFHSDYPTLAAYLTAAAWPDGEVRQLSSLVIFCEDGVFKACLSDKDTGNVLWASSRVWSDLPLSLEARLTEDSPDWRKGRKYVKKT
jgi:hypothetical protein